MASLPFTIRVEFGASRRTIYPASEYRVEGANGTLSIISTGDGGEQRTIEIPEGSVAFVTNAAGATIDVIRHSRRTAELRHG
jgi:hypothetical protein